jgi:hypothetical protein
MDAKDYGPLMMAFHWVSDWQQRDVWGGEYRKDNVPI